MSEMKWIKVTTDIFSNRKIRQIECSPGGSDTLLIWFKLLCLAGSVNDGGLVYCTKEIPYTADMLAVEFRTGMDTITRAIDTFRKFGMIENQDGYIKIRNWAKYQTVDKTSDLREYNRQAQQRRRAKCNADPCQDAVNSLSTECQPSVNQASTFCQPNVNQMPTQEREREEEEEKDISLSLSPRASAADTETEKPLLTDGEREKLVALMGEEMLGLYLANLKAYIAEGGKVRNPSATIEKFWREDAKKTGKKSGAPPGDRKREKIIGGSFDTDEFFAGALRRSYGDDPNNTGRLAMSHGKIASLDDHKKEAAE